MFYSKNAEADRAFFRDGLKYPHADAGHGWLIFALPPAEVAIHPSDENDGHQLYSRKRWGSLTSIALPGGGKVGVYQPRHPSPVLP